MAHGCVNSVLNSQVHVAQVKCPHVVCLLHKELNVCANFRQPNLSQDLEPQVSDSRNSVSLSSL